MKKQKQKSKKRNNGAKKQLLSFAPVLLVVVVLFITLGIVLLMSGRPVTERAIAAPILTHGPVTGGVTANEAKVFVRTDQIASVRIKYSTDPNLSNPATSQTLSTILASDFTATITLSELSPQTTYYMDVLVNDISQFTAPYPSFTTFPASQESQDFKFIVLNDFIAVPKATRTWPTFATASLEGAAFAFIGGDFDHRNPDTLAAKRKVKKDLYNPNSLGLSDFVNGILRKMPIIHQWDDHDSGADNNDKNYPYWNLSCQAYKEYVPHYDLPTTVSCGIWQKFKYAQADFFVLDDRSQRDPGTDLNGPAKSMLDGNNIGAGGQLEWIKQGLLNSTARWKIVFTSVVTTPKSKPTDSWAAYQYEWNILRDFIKNNNITGVFFISGDLHVGGIDNGTNSGFPEMVVPGSNLEPAITNNCSTGAPGPWSAGVYQNKGPCNGYGVVTVLTNPDRLLLQVKDENGNTKVSYTLN